MTQTIDDGIDLERGTANVERILHTEHGSPSEGVTLTLPPQPTPPASQAPARKQRSDAGKPREKKAEPVAGRLTKDQAEKIGHMAAGVRIKDQLAKEAAEEYERAYGEFKAYLDKLTIA
jgi:hypothetical protein